MTDRRVRMSGPTLRALRLFLEKPGERRSGAEICRDTNIGSGTLYPMLARLEQAGWLISEWEKIDPREAGRPRRRYYRITATGQNLATAAFAELGVPEGTFAWSQSRLD